MRRYLVAAHYKTRAILSQGLIYLRHDGTLEWVDTDDVEISASLLPRFKQLIGQGWNVYLSYPSSKPVWGRYDLDPIQYLADSVSIPVEPSDFVLGGGI